MCPSSRERTHNSKEEEAEKAEKVEVVDEEMEEAAKEVGKEVA
jgi:hypothetical protein